MSKMTIIKYDSFEVVIKEDRKLRSIRLRFEPGKVKISTFRKLTIDEVNNYLTRYKEDLYKMVIEPINNKNIHILGQKYQIELREAKHNLAYIEEDKLIVNYRMESSIKNIIKKYLLEEFNKVYLKHYQLALAKAKNILGLVGEPILDTSFRYNKRVFGTCYNKTRRIRLSYSLVKYDQRVIYSIACHELCHLFEPNHSAKFYKLVLKIDPSYDDMMKYVNKINKEIRKDYI